MRHLRTTLPAIIAVLAFAAAGCGGSEVDADEVPGNPPALTVPTDSELESGGSDADAETDESTDETTDPDAAAEDPAGTGAVEPAVPEEQADTSGGAAAPEEQAAAPEDTTADPAQPPADSPPEQFESFCEQNAGAC
jgi:hypothetical protein